MRSQITFYVLRCQRVNYQNGDIKNPTLFNIFNPIAGIFNHILDMQQDV